VISQWIYNLRKQSTIDSDFDTIVIDARKEDEHMIDAILDRKSVRTYVKKPLNTHDVELIGDIIRQIEPAKGPFGHQIRYFFYNQDTLLDDEAKKIGTYGFIKNAPSFVGGVIENSFQAMVDYGYLFENMILHATKEGFGTVWLGGTFDRSAFSSYTKSNEIIPAITPIGYEADQRFFEKVIRYVAKANRRKAFHEMFYQKDLMHPIQHDAIDGFIKKSLEYVQVGPSASNKQPWRIIIDENIVHFYLEKTPNYATMMPFDMQALDMGISICHFEQGLIEAKKEYQFKILSDCIQPGWIYILSIEINL